MMTMRSDTRATTIPARAEEVFAFLADPRNLPRWAVGFARDILQEGEQWIVQTRQGRVPVRLVTDVERGTIDFHMAISPETEVVAFSRVLPNGPGAEYVFTQFQAPGMPDDVFEGQRSALAEELDILSLLFRAQAACPSSR